MIVADEHKPHIGLDQLRYEEPKEYVQRVHQRQYVHVVRERAVAEELRLDEYDYAQRVQREAHTREQAAKEYVNVAPQLYVLIQVEQERMPLVYRVVLRGVGRLERLRQEVVARLIRRRLCLHAIADHARCQLRIQR